MLKPVDIQADHVIPASLGGPSDLGNLVPLCGPCNVRKGCTPTHATERRWRVRTLFEALVSAHPDNMPSIYERYCQFRTLSFCADASSRGAATYSRRDSTLFLRMLGDAGDLELDQVESVNWPVSPLENLEATHGEWLSTLAENTQAALQRLPQLRRLPGLQGWEHAPEHSGRRAA